MKSLAQCGCALVAVLAVVSGGFQSAFAQQSLPPYGYYSWTANGCPAAQMGADDFNKLSTLSPAQWWTVTFTDATKALGGMVNFVRLLAGAGSAVQVTLTNGEGATPILSHTQQIHGLGFKTNGDDSFCIGTPGGTDYGCFEQSVPLGAVRATGSGTGADGTVFVYDLTLSRQLNDTWCMLKDASKSINIKWPQEVTWYHFLPAASVTGFLSFNGTEYPITGTGQQDHVFGTFVPGVTLFQHWTDAHFFNAETGFNMYWGEMKDSWTFARVEHPLGSMTFTTVTSSRQYGSTGSRPISYSVEASAEDGSTFKAAYKPIVPGLDYGSANIEDIVALSGSLCFAGKDCVDVSARGWAQVLGGRM